MKVMSSISHKVLWKISLHSLCILLYVCVTNKFFKNDEKTNMIMIGAHCKQLVMILAIQVVFHVIILQPYLVLGMFKRMLTGRKITVLKKRFTSNFLFNTHKIDFGTSYWKECNKINVHLEKRWDCVVIWQMSSLHGKVKMFMTYSHHIVLDEGRPPHSNSNLKPWLFSLVYLFIDCKRKLFCSMRVNLQQLLEVFALFPLGEGGAELFYLCW